MVSWVVGTGHWGSAVPPGTGSYALPEESVRAPVLEVKFRCCAAHTSSVAHLKSQDQFTLQPNTLRKPAAFLCTELGVIKDC